MTQTTTGTRVFGHYIGGKWGNAESGPTFDTTNPATGAPVATYARGTAVDVDAAVAAAKTAFVRWRLVPAPRRGEILYRVGQLLATRKEALARAITKEMGKVLVEACGDVQEGIDMAFYMGGEGRRLFGQQVPAELPNKWATAVRKPLGVCGMITPWNFPIAIPTWKIMPALVAGNTVVFKPATLTPLLAVRLTEVFEEAGLPPGVLNLVLGTGGEVGDAIPAHPDIALVSFTGSTETGDHVALEAARTCKRVSLELGGKNAIIVLDAADLDLALDGIVWSAFGTSGQRCTAASRVIVHRSVERALTDRLAEQVGTLRLGNGMQEGIEIGPVISRSRLERINSYMAIGRQGGRSWSSAARSPVTATWRAATSTNRRSSAAQRRPCASRRRRFLGR